MAALFPDPRTSSGRESWLHFLIPTEFVVAKFQFYLLETIVAMHQSRRLPPATDHRNMEGGEPFPCPRPMAHEVEEIRSTSLISYISMANNGNGTSTRSG